MFSSSGAGLLFGEMLPASWAGGLDREGGVSAVAVESSSPFLRGAGLASSSRSSFTLLDSWGIERMWDLFRRSSPPVGVDTLYDRGAPIFLTIVAGSHFAVLGFWMTTFCPCVRLGRLFEH